MQERSRVAPSLSNRCAALMGTSGEAETKVAVGGWIGQEDSTAEE